MFEADARAVLSTFVGLPRDMIRLFELITIESVSCL